MARALMGEDLPTIDGPEDERLLNDLSGCLLLSDRSRELTVFLLDRMDKQVLRLEEKPIHHSAVSPAGEMLYCWSGQTRYGLRVVTFGEATEHVLLTREGLLDPESKIVLAPDGQHIAFLFRVFFSSAQLRPTWQLEILDVDGTSRVVVVAEASMGGPRWYPDSYRLAFPSPSGLGVLDIRTGEVEVLGIVRAGDPCVREGGDSLLVTNRGQASVVDGGGAPVPVNLPGLLFAATAWLKDGRVIYEGLPTSGQEQRYNGAFQAWPTRYWTIKIANPRTGAFATIVPYFGFGSCVYSDRSP